MSNPILPLLDLKAIVAFSQRIEMPMTGFGCWEWQGGHNAKGYGTWTIRRRPLLAHRISFAMENGEIPEGLELDHLCRNRGCVRPDHLEAVTHTVNVQRGERAMPRAVLKLTCKNGHPFSADNVVRRADGWRTCVICLRATHDRRNAKNRATRAAAKRERLSLRTMAGLTVDPDVLSVNGRQHVLEQLDDDQV